MHGKFEILLGPAHFSGEIGTWERRAGFFDRLSHGTTFSFMVRPEEANPSYESGKISVLRDYPHSLCEAPDSTFELKLKVNGITKAQDGNEKVEVWAFTGITEDGGRPVSGEYNISKRDGWLIIS